MDKTRLQPSILEMAAAEAAYDAALRSVAAATRRATQSPLDKAAAKALEFANNELTLVRKRVATARVALDVVRRSELLTLETGDQLLGSVAGDQVLSLFPVSIEAKLEPGRLRIRVWPDAISTSTHDPRLTGRELDATKQYWRAEAATTGDEASRAAWRALCDVIGVARAAWASQVLTPINRDVLGPGVDPVFPIVPMMDEDAPFVPRAAVLPDRWIAIGTRSGKRIFERLGAPIPLDLAVGLDTTPSETATLTNREGEPIQLPPRMRWMTDFATGVQVGMALSIPLAADVDRLDELLVFGLRLTQTPAQSAETLAGLFTGHRFSRGFAFVPQDTPTNNSTTGGSGLSSRSQRIDDAFNLERKPRAFRSNVASNGMTAALAFGVAPEVFASLPTSGAVSDIATEPDGFEPEAALAMQTLMWQVTLGSAIEDFLLLPDSRGNAVRNYFRRHVRAAGPVSAVRVGRQPYGVLPVTTINDFIAGADEGIDAQLLPLLRATRAWFAMLRQGEVFGGSPESALRQLGRSTRLFAETTRQNPKSTAQNRWASLAHSLAVASRNTIRDTWRNTRITGTIERSPKPVKRPITDEATATELAALANAPPGVILIRPLATSVLGRIARQAALLEWSRFARVVCNAAVDVASRRDLAQRAAQQGSNVYIAVLLQTMTQTINVPLDLPVDPTPSPGGSAKPRPLDDDGPPDLPDNDPDPPDPDPPPKVGEPAVTAAERNRIRALVGSLDRPLASCPGATRLASFRQALAQLSRFPASRLESEMFGVFDICNHRLDAWFTSLASRRLATLRAATPVGTVIGGWGCLQDVRRASPLDPQQRAEFIHTPSLDQAAAVAVLRSGARRAQSGGSNHADIDLSSRRVRLARWILEGLRNGRSLGELLGVRFERAIKGTPAAEQLEDLRALFPGSGRMSVLDGLLLQKAGPPNPGNPDVVRAATVVDEALDAVADSLTAEAVYQIVKGNPVGALISLEGIMAGTVPPELNVTQTPASGIRLTHRLAVALPANAVAPGWETNISPRSRAEPLLDAWCGLLLGPAEGTVLTVEGSSGATMSVRLSSLGIGAIDIVLAGRNKGAELAEFVVHAASTSTSELRVREDRTWKDLVGLCSAIARVLTGGEVLRPDAFDPPSAMITAADENFGDLAARVADAATALSAIRDALIARTDPAGAVLRAAEFGVRVPGVLLGATPAIEQQDALLADIEARLVGAITGTPRERVRALFGGDLPGLVTFLPRDPAMLVTAASPPPASLLGGELLAPRAWLDAAVRNHPKAASLAEVLLRREIAGDTGSTRLLIAQAPWVDGDRWIATSFTNTSKEPPAGRLSVLMHAPAGFTATEPVGGLLIDSWTETVPAATRDTAMALRFNNASTRPPQVILLAVNPNPAQAWTTNTLVDVLSETLMLTRLRMQASTTFSRGGLMPFAWLGQRPGNTGISFSL